MKTFSLNKSRPWKPVPLTERRVHTKKIKIRLSVCLSQVKGQIRPNKLSLRLSGRLQIADAKYCKLLRNNETSQKKVVRSLRVKILEKLPAHAPHRSKIKLKQKMRSFDESSPTEMRSKNGEKTSEGHFSFKNWTVEKYEVKSHWSMTNIDKSSKIDQSEARF
jgi:hypothetical protein